MTHTDKMRLLMADTKELTQAFTGLKDEDYNLFQFEVGSTWVDLFTQDTKASSILTCQPIFWSWFKIHWQKTEEEFLDNIKLDDISDVWYFSHKNEPNVRYYSNFKRLYLFFIADRLLNCESKQEEMQLSFHNLIKWKDIND